VTLEKASVTTRCRMVLHVNERPRDLTRRQVRSEITRLIKKWTPRFAMDQWALVINFDDTLAVEGDCHAKPRYEEATITFNVPRIQLISARSGGELEELIVHELVHCIAWGASEAEVSRVARALLRTERLVKMRRRG
jgi:hypothetical protein